TPTLFVLDWLIFVPKREVPWKTSLGGLALPLVYLAWTLLHGAITGFYPYPFLNVLRLGYEQVFINIVGLIVAFVILMLGLVGTGRLLAASPLRSRSANEARRNPG